MKTKTFTVVITSAYEWAITEDRIKQALSVEHPFNTAAIQVHEVNKKTSCDGCGKERRDVKAMGKDANGDPDAPDLCFICRKEMAKHRWFSHSKKRYVRFEVDL